MQYSHFRGFPLSCVKSLESRQDLGYASSSRSLWPPVQLTLPIFQEESFFKAVPSWNFIQLLLRLWLLNVDQKSGILSPTVFKSMLRHWFPLSWTKQAWRDRHDTLRECWYGSLQVEEWIHVNEMEYYCPGSNQWTTLKLPPFNCCQFSIAAHDATLYLAGGGALQHMQKEDSVFLYNTVGCVWKKASPLPKALVDHASCMIKLPQVNAAGGTGRGTKCFPACRRKKSVFSLFITKEPEFHSASEK